ncbi:MAG TPA: hypothetical protein DHW79_06355, partial [Candidatus Cloacimonas sp.]|nr:hypothetical protein [Candidatus Cloacimonas sp.]
MKHMLATKQYLCLILVLLFAFSALVAQEDPLTRKVTFNADDATLSSVLNALSRLSGTNIVLAVEQTGDADKENEKRVTINIKEVPIETAVSLVARTTGLSYRIVAGNTFVVGPKQNIMEEVGERSNVLYLNNLDATKVAASLEDAGGRIVPVEGQNAIMVYANQETFEQIRSLVEGMDTAQDQIEIRVRLIEVNLSNAKEVGIDWSRLNHLTTIIAEDPIGANGQ